MKGSLENLHVHILELKRLIELIEQTLYCKIVK